MQNIFIGIDPGLDGALVAIDGCGLVVCIKDTPTVSVKKGKGQKRVYVDGDMVGVLEVLNSHNHVVMVGIENVHAMPKQGVTSMFSMGYGFGLWSGILSALKLPYERIEPVVWKKTIGGLVGEDKGQSIIIARRLFPGASLDRKKDHGRADALLIAECMRRKHSGPSITHVNPNSPLSRISAEYERPAIPLDKILPRKI